MPTNGPFLLPHLWIGDISPSMRKATLILSCLFLLVGNGASQRTRSSPKPKPDILNGGLVPIPKDEILFSDEERQRLMHSGWRIAVRGAEDSKGIVSLVYYDHARIEHLASVVRTWLKWEDQKTGELASYSMSLEEYDCSGKRWHTLERTEYDKNSQVKGTTKFPTAKEWDYVVPESVGEQLYYVLCQNRLDQEAMDASLASKWFREARQSEKRGNLEDAVFWYKAALESAPTNEKIRTALARLQK